MTDTAPKFTVSTAPADKPAKRGPGRPPGSTNKATKEPATVTKAEVDKAMATLESSYNLITTGLVMFGLTDSATAWVESSEELNKTNRDALTASPKITKAIIQTGNTGGSFTFLLTHGMAFAGLAKAVNIELAARRASAAQEARKDAGDEFNIAPPADVDPAFIPGL
ncbi:hypothetical protein SEA_LUZDEMUNDO_11 [Microbacterium phage LuzDeMundo]|nr:hypothetical protein SEA_LUZDEMUNDO_11 [Microbacterium phage LuzDeMundo]